MAGIDETGFTALSLADIQDDLTAKLQAQFGGTTLDVSSQSVFGQLIGILANGYADLWAAGQAIYANQFPGTASGVGVDNILAINNLKRLQAAATVTNPNAARDENGFVRYGLLCFGTPGTAIPAGTLISNGASTPYTFALDSDLTIAPSSNAVQTLYFAGQPTSGSFVLTLMAPGAGGLTTPAIPYNADASATKLLFSSSVDVADASFTLSLNGQQTDTISAASDAAPVTAGQVQAAIAALPAYSQATVSGTVAAGFRILWGRQSAPIVTASGTGAPDGIVQSVSAYVHNLTETSGVQPFTDVQCLGGTQSIQFTFGSQTPRASMPSSGATAIQPIATSANSLTTGSSPVSLVVQTQAQGAPAQAIGSATCTQPGYNAVLAGQLTTIINPINGFTGCINELDCLTGRDVETDSEAILRLQGQLGSAASGSLAAIIKRVQAVSGVTQVVGAQNLTSAAQQVLVFTGKPTTGQFSVRLGGSTTALCNYNVSASGLQQAINALPGYEQVQVSAYGTTGYVLDFQGLAGKQSQPLAAIPVNTTTLPITPYFGRAPHSVEIVVQGGADSDVAAAILAALPAGVGTYSNPEARCLGQLTAGSSSIGLSDATGVQVGQSVAGQGVPLGATVVAVSGKTITLSNNATISGSSIALTFQHNILLADAAGNPVSVGFSRPVTTQIFVALKLVTDRFVVPGDSTSAQNANSRFSLENVASIQQAIIDVINSTRIGGLIIANGSGSLGGSFRQTLGINDYTLFFDRVSPPANQANLQLAANEAPLADSTHVSITYV